jgi:hypothetical protein
MFTKTLLGAIWGGIAAFALFLTSPVLAQDDAMEPIVEVSEKATEVVENAVATEEQAQTDESRERIIQEAVSALQETRKALAALDEERPDDALASLALATGQLELVVARDPELALAPTGVAVTTHDIYGSADAIEAAIEEAEDLLSDGMVQAARRLLDGIASETVVSVTSIPLATYPEAIKAVVPLIDDGKLADARHGLQSVLNTLVRTDHVIPLPIVRAQALLKQAELLTEQEDWNAEESEELTRLLSAARDQLEMADRLGYGTKESYDDLYTAIEEVEVKTRDGEARPGLFSSVEESVARLWTSIAG